MTTNKPTKEDIIRSVDSLQKEAISLLSDLVRFDSTLGNEDGVQSFMEGVFRDTLGLKVDRFAVVPDDIKGLKGFSPVDWSYEGKTNVVGVHTPSGGTPLDPPGKSLILNGHVDVVPTGPVAMWTRPPFEPYVSEGRLYGRGSGDMKAGIAAMVIAMRAIKSLGYSPASKVIMESVVEEECSGNGALACLARGYTADAAIIPEPFPFIVTAQVGVMWLRVTVEGLPAHVLNTSAGVNAVEAAFHLFNSLRQLESMWNDPATRPEQYKDHKHPINFNLGVLQGGEWPSSVPCQCEFDVRVGMLPGMGLDDARSQIESCLAKAASEKGVEHKVVYRGFQAEGCFMDRALCGPMIDLLGECHVKATNGDVAPLAPITCTTDARYFLLYAGIPATCYGPEAQNIHGIDESVSVDSMMTTAKTLALFISDWCGLVPL